MPTFSTPTHPLQLPPTILTFPPVRSEPTARCLVQQDHFALKLKIAPRVLLPPHLISSRINGRKLEDCVETIVPLSGTVKVKIDVTLPVDHSCEQDGAEASIPNNIKGHIKESIEQARDALGLSNIEEEDPNADDHENDPVIHLQQIDLSFSWSRIDVALNSTNSDGEMPVMDDGFADSGIDMDPGSVDQGSPDQDGGCDETGGADQLDSNLPRWLGLQLQEGVNKVLRIHFIKRFPLVFDAAFSRYVPAFTPRRSTITALSSFSCLSKRPRPSLHDRLIRRIGLMIESLDEHVRVQADSATRLRQSAKKQKSKRAVAENDTQVTEKSSDEVKKDSEELAPECRLERHMAIRVDKVKKLDSNNDRWVMALLLEALGIVGRTKWQECRSSARKMGANRIQLYADDSNGPDVTNSQAARQVELVADLVGEEEHNEDRRPILHSSDHRLWHGDIDAFPEPEEHLREAYQRPEHESGDDAALDTQYAFLPGFVEAEMDKLKDPHLGDWQEDEADPHTISLLPASSTPDHHMAMRPTDENELDPDGDLLIEETLEEEGDFSCDWGYARRDDRHAQIYPDDDLEDEFDAATTVLCDELDDGLSGDGDGGFLPENDQRSENDTRPEWRNECFNDVHPTREYSDVVDDLDDFVYEPPTAHRDANTHYAERLPARPHSSAIFANTSTGLDMAHEEDFYSPFLESDGWEGEGMLSDDLEDDLADDPFDDVESGYPPPLIQQYEYVDGNEDVIDDLDDDYDYNARPEYALHDGASPYAAKEGTLYPLMTQDNHLELPVFDDLDF